MINFFNTHISQDAVKKVAEVLSSTFVSEGKLVVEFEKKLTSELGISNPVALNSGTSALHLALVLAGVQSGDEVILPAQTFIASGLAVKYVGATPVFADIQYETGNIDPASIKQKISEKTKAILVVHWAGYPCDMSEILKLAKYYNIPVIEDAAHALGATYHNAPIGTISAFTCFSFQAIKHLTTGDGGAISFLDKNKMQDARRLRWFGIDRAGSSPTNLGERKYNVKDVGFKYHLNDYSAALGLSNLNNFLERLAYVRWIDNFYREKLKDVSGITLFRQDKDRKSACWLFGIHTDSREEFISKMKRHGIPVSVVHRRIDRNEVFGRISEELEVQKLFDLTQIHLPIHPNLTIENVEYIVQQIKAG